MKTLKRQKLVWEFTCPGCHTLLELDETDFKTVTYVDTYGDKVTGYDCLATPCPICGITWRKVNKNSSSLHEKLVPVEE
jgi:hypothetical protein